MQRLSFACVITLVMLHFPDGFVGPSAAQGAQEALATMARTIIARPGTLADTDITTIQQAVRAALANRYIVVRFDGVRADADKGREDEYLFDARGRVRFHRYSQTDPVRPGERQWSLSEFTDNPAIRCQDGFVYPQRRAGMTFYQDWKGWHHGNPMVVDDAGSPWTTASPGFWLVNGAASELLDGGIKRVDGQQVRVIRRANPIGEEAVWIDVQSLLPLRQAVSVSMNGQSVEHSSTYQYPVPRPIARPAEISFPSCL